MGGVAIHSSLLVLHGASVACVDASDAFRDGSNSKPCSAALCANGQDMATPATTCASSCRLDIVYPSDPPILAVAVEDSQGFLAVILCGNGSFGSVMWSAAPDPSGRPCPPSNAPLLPVSSKRKGGIDTAQSKIRVDFGTCHVDRISIHRGGVRGGNSSDWWAGRWGVAEEKAEGCSGDVTVSHRGRLERSCNRRCVRTADEVESTPPKAKSASAASSTNEELITSRSSR